jgi:DNA-binding transcriptional LysR family regulator
MAVDRLSAMETFVRVVDTGSFSAAARQLRIGQPAVSKAMAALEERLGTRLLLRSSRGLAATEAGQNFYERAKRAIEEADEAEVVARGEGAGLVGRLRFSAGVTFARLHLLPKLPSFLSRHPALSVEAVLDDRNIDPVEEGIDVALRMGDLTDSTLVARRIAGCRRIVVGTPAYFAEAGQPLSPADLSSHRAVIYGGRGGGDCWTFRKGDSELSVALNGRLRTTAAEGIREAVFADMGIAISTEWAFKSELANGTVREVLTDWDLPPVDLWALFPSGRRATAKARAFADFVESIIAEKGAARPRRVKRS